MHRLGHVGVVCLGFVALFTTACGSSKSTNIRLLNAFSSQPGLDMLLDGKDVASAIAYGSGSAYVSANSGSRHLQVETTGTTSIVADLTTSLGSGSYSTALSTSSGTSVVTDDHTAPSSGNVKIRAINASSILGTADIYIITAGGDISSMNPTYASVPFPSATAYSTLAAGSYQVIFTLPGQKFAVISSSGQSFASGQIRTVVGMDGQGGGYTTSVLADLN